MLPLGSEGGFHFRIIWDEELDTEMGSRGTEGSAKEKGDRFTVRRRRRVQASSQGMRGKTQVREIMKMFSAVLFNIRENWHYVECLPSESMGYKITIHGYQRLCRFHVPPVLQQTFTAAVPNLFGTRDQFCWRQFFHGLEVGVVSG